MKNVQMILNQTKMVLKKQSEPFKKGIAQANQRVFMNKETQKVIMVRSRLKINFLRKKLH